jgi:hypothetical protein
MTDSNVYSNLKFDTIVMACRMKYFTYNELKLATNNSYNDFQMAFNSLCNDKLIEFNRMTDGTTHFNVCNDFKLVRDYLNLYHLNVVESLLYFITNNK